MNAVTIHRGAKQRIAGAGTATATEATREHKQYAIQGPTTSAHNASNDQDQRPLYVGLDA